MTSHASKTLWRSDDLPLAIGFKLLAAAPTWWVSQYLPGSLKFVAIVAAVGMALSAGSPKVFRMSASMGAAAWLFAFVSGPMRNDGTSMPFLFGVGMALLTVFASRQALLELHIGHRSRTPFSPRQQLVDVARAGAAMLLVGLLVLPIMSLFGAPTPLGGSLFAGEGDGVQPYIGFTDRMDTGIRGDLGDDIVMRVRTEEPAFWRGQTFDRWDGRYWSRSEDRTERFRADENGNTTFGYPRETGQVLTQTFTLESDGSDVVFGAPAILQIDHPVDLFNQSTTDGTIRAPIDLAAGSQYTVVSERPYVTPDMLRKADPVTIGIPDDIAAMYLDNSATDRVADLAARITADSPATYDKILALEAWMGQNIQYQTDIPALAEDSDAVEQLLFVDKLGYCEQIGTSLAVMARSLGIPARLAVGYVPNEYDSFRGSYTVRARDAHAWTEIYFPGIGWQGFDPTAEVPLSGNQPDRVGVDDDEPTESTFNLSVGLVVGVVILGVLLTLAMIGLGKFVAYRRMGWEAKAAARLDRIGADAGRKRKVSEAPGAFATMLGKRSGRAELVELGTLLDRAQFSPGGAAEGDQKRAEALLDGLENLAKSSL